MIDQDSCEWVIADEWKGPPPDGWHAVTVIWHFDGQSLPDGEHWTNGEPDTKYKHRSYGLISSKSFPTKQAAYRWAIDNH